MPWGDAARHALFQSVSAFCNAGFFTFSDSLEGWAAYGFVTWPIMLLIVVGGIGFLTLEELDQLRRQRKAGRRLRLSLHSRVVLASTAALLGIGGAVYLGLKWKGVLAGMTVWTKFEKTP